MAALQKIRSKGAILLLVVGLALFAFIAEEVVRALSSSRTESRQSVGEVYGESINIQEYNELVDEYTSVVKFSSGLENLTEEQTQSIRDQVWQTYVQNQLLQHEAEELGLTVSDAEVQDIINNGQSPLLSQTPFSNPQTGAFDVQTLNQFLTNYKAMKEQPGQPAEALDYYKQVYNYWKFIEKNLRQQMLAQKYQTLLGQCLLSNPVSAKMAFEGQNQESDIQLAALPYSAIKDADVTVSDADLKAKYDEKKEMFKQYVESRDIKYVDYQVVASAADRTALMKTMQEAQQNFQAGQAVAEVVRKAQSQQAYVGIPVSRNALPSDIAAKIDSMTVGSVSAPFETKFDNTLNVVKLVNKVQLPDSVEYRQIQVGAETAEAAKKRADSIYTALQGGAEFEALAKKYGQPGDKQWLTSAMYERAQNLDADTKNYLNVLTTLGAGESKNLEMSQGNIIIQVTARRAMVDKYDVAIVKHTIDFSKDTYSQAYNKFSQYVSENKTLEQLEANAKKFGFNVQERKDLYSSEHNVAGLRSTRDAMKWIFDSKAGEVSPLYECGNNDHLLVIALTKVHAEGYRDLADVEEMVKQEVIRDKKFQKAAEQLAGVKSVADAKAKGATVDSVRQITFSAPVFVQSAGASEPALSGAVAAAKAGQFVSNAVKGNGAAYVFQVLQKKEREGAKMDAKQQQTQLKQMAMQAASRFMNELYLKAGVKDNRYLFF